VNRELPWIAMTGQSPEHLRHYRLSDGERDIAISALADAYAEGRLDVAEFESRMEAASQAKVAADLEPLFVDLPHSRARIETRPSPRPSSRPVPAARCMAAGRTRPHPPWGLMPLLFLAVLLMTAHVWLVIPLMIMLSHRAHHVRRGLRTARSGRLTERGW
jgi:hypothetical protein